MRGVSGAVLVCVLVSSAGFAEEFAILGPRAMGMGGAGVATTRGALSTYWNPANLAPPRTPQVDTLFDMSLSLSANGSATEDVLGVIDRLSDLASGIDFGGLETAFETGQNLSADQVQDVLQLIEDINRLSASGTGLVSNVTPGIHLRFGRFGFSGIGLLNAGGLTNIDTDFLSLGNFGLDTILGGLGTNAPATPAGQTLATDLENELTSLGVPGAAALANQLAFQAEESGVDLADPDFQSLLNQVVQDTVDAQGNPVSPDEFLSGNNTGVDLRGIALQEYALGYSQPVLNLFSVGVAAKLLYGKTFFNPFTLNNIGDFGDLITELTMDALEGNSLDFGIDAGVLMTPTDWLSVGVVGKYLNRPTFEFAGEGDYVLDPQVRAGVALGPFAGFTLAADIDVIENTSSALPDFRSQVLGGGIEYNLLNVLFLRGGVSKNLAESTENPVIHAGLGVRAFGVTLEAAGLVSTELTAISIDPDGSEVTIPERSGLSFMFSVNVPIQ